MNVSNLLVLVGSFHALSLMVSCAGSKQGRSGNSDVFMSLPVTVDGNDSEWPGPYPNYNAKSHISYIVINDSKNLYVTVKVSDKQTQRKVLIGGMSVWIDPRGNKERVAGICYPLRNPDRDVSYLLNREHDKPDLGEQPSLRDSSAQQQRPGFPLPKVYSIIGFTGCEGGFSLTGNNPCGIQVALGRNDNNELVWEAAFPLDWLYPDLKTTRSRGNEPLNVGFEIGGMPIPAVAIDDGPGPGQNYGGNGNVRMRGMSGRGHGDGSGYDDVESLSQTSTTWTKTFLTSF